VKAFAPLKRPIVARLWTALAVFTTGDELYRVALVWLAVGIVGRQAGYLSAAQSGCMLLGAAFGGTLVAGASQQRAMSIFLAVGAACVLVPPVAWGLGYPSFIALLVPAISVSLMRAQLEPAIQGHLPLLVPDRDELFATNGLIDGVRRMARITGPIFAAALAAVIAVHNLFVVYAVALLFAAYLLLRVGDALPVREGRSDAGFLLGLRIVRGERVLRSLLLLKSLTDGCWVVVIGHALPLTIEQSGASWLGISGVTAYGTGLATYGIANIVSNVTIISVTPSLSPARMVAGLTSMGAGLCVMGLGALLSTNDTLLPALYAGLALAAIGGPICDIPLAMHIQLAGGPNAPRAAASSVHRVRLFMTFTGIMLAGLLSPSMFGAFGVAQTMLGAGMVCAGVSLAAFLLIRREQAARRA
jgi:DHA3 family macrolide efflux protein-like MFS transporter